MGQDTVECRPAYVWDCPNCKTQNWTEGILVPADWLKEIAEQVKVYDEHLDPPESLSEPPFEVTCSNCKIEMYTKQVIF